MVLSLVMSIWIYPPMPPTNICTHLYKYKKSIRWILDLVFSGIYYVFEIHELSETMELCFEL